MRTVTIRAFSIAVICLCFGCAPFNYTGDDAPVALASIAPASPSPRIAVVLGAGGPRGYAHIGVLTVLEEAGVDIELIVGTSVGSLIGVLWASGMTAAEIDRLSTEGGPLTIFDPSLFADRGWIRGQRLQDYVNNTIDNVPLQALPRQVIVASTRRDDKLPAYFLNGNSGVAVRASSAVPGVFSPVGINGTEYEDGDVSLPLAIEAAHQSGAEFIIAVNVYTRAESVPKDASEKLIKQAQRRRVQIEQQLDMADFVIHPDTPFRASPRKKFFVASRSVGEAEARARLPALLQELSVRGLIDRPSKEQPTDDNGSSE